jgi:signal transduction histidine kinase
MLECTIAVLVLIFIVLVIIFFKYQNLRNDLKQINKRLNFINKEDTNLLIDSPSNLKEVVELSSLINQSVKGINELKQKILHEERELKNTITNLSHDLRTPMTSILGYTELLMEEKQNPKSEEYIKIIKSRLESLKELIEQLFNYSVIYESEEVLTIEEENVNLILEDAIALFYNDLINKNINPIIEIPEKAIIKKINKFAFKRVLINLLNNIIKYGETKLTIMLDENQIMFRNIVHGVDTIDIEKVFDRYFTLAKARTNGSMGLGLTISKVLMEKMNGSINAYIEKDEFVIILKFN